MGVIILLRAGQKYISEEYTMETIVAAPNEVRKEVTMSDNSKVWLNSNATLKYAPDYRVDRKASIVGEAYLKVSIHEKIFSLTVDEVTLFTYGASLLVNDNFDEAAIRIVLYVGELEMESSNWTKPIAMYSGTELLLDKKTGEIQIYSVIPHVQGPEWVVHYLY